MSRKVRDDSIQTSVNDDEDNMETSCSAESHNIYKMENDDLRHRVSLLQVQLEKATQVLSYSTLQHNENMLVHYTGIRMDMFEILLNMCCRFEIKYVDGWHVDSVTKADQLLLTLMKLRGNFTHLDLGFRFGVSRTTVKNIVTTWIFVLHDILYKGILLANGIPSVAKNKGCLPSCFSSFSGCRITLDCTEVQCAIPNASMTQQRQTFSAYKQRNTFKGLIGVAPNGVITFVSSLYPGSTSDKCIVSHCGVLAKMQPGDMILADKGFVMQDLLPPGVSLNVPPFLKNRRFTKKEAQLTTTIARARIHVERAIARLKNHQILTFIPKHYRHSATKIFQVCACLVNFQAPILKAVEAIGGAESNECDESFTL